MEDMFSYRISRHILRRGFSANVDSHICQRDTQMMSHTVVSNAEQLFE